MITKKIISDILQDIRKVCENQGNCDYCLLNNVICIHIPGAFIPSQWTDDDLYKVLK